MSLAETFDPITWPALSADEKRDAVFELMLRGRTVQEIAEALSITYGTIGANHVRGVIDRHNLAEEPAALAAKQRRCSEEQAASRARARARKPLMLPRVSALPKIPLPKLSATSAGSGITLFDLKNGMCRAPLWDDSAVGVHDKFYCGAPAKDGQSYCASCCERLHAPARERIVFHTPAAAASVNWRVRAR
ncbi:MULTISPECIES: GcrA family cell cycle regulator [unclassified Roseibium]|uniref:GcrA family cell cycle regulator n=1 Tax=unclassified Roseibium TaxID=2629323 RepID=UPI0027401767|nr:MULTISPECIES: GcrA family cell cycle regulator [unclassified Roseibium]